MSDHQGNDALDTEALLDQGEKLLAQSARLLRRLDAALDRANTPPEGTPTVTGDEPPPSPPR